MDTNRFWISILYPVSLLNSFVLVIFFPLRCSTYRIMSMQMNIFTFSILIWKSLLILLKKIFPLPRTFSTMLIDVTNLNILALFQRLVGKHSNVFLSMLFLMGYQPYFIWTQPLSYWYSVNWFTKHKFSNLLASIFLYC